MALGVDTGGTFTDFFLIDGARCRIHKVLSTPHAPEQAILQGLKDLGLQRLMASGELLIIHGSTVATNAALQRKGVRTVFITNRGFGDMLTLARQNRPDIYALEPSGHPPPVPETLCLEVDCRRDANGDIVTSLDEREIARVVDQVEALRPKAVAINFLFSYLAAADERAIAERLQQSYFVSCSSEVLPEYKEYERGIATWLNAWLGPVVNDYMVRLQEAVSPCPLGVMQSSGGTIDAAQAGRRAVNLLLSGPAGGLAAARHIGEALGKSRLLTFDMGGTSTDVSLIDGDILLSTQGRIGPYPVAVPMVDIHTIGAGGGSLAYVDEGGMLHVGPESAGASPGPACYGLGGNTAAVTDANVVLGLIRPEHFLGGRMQLDAEAARASLRRLGETLGVDEVEVALGVIALANEHMVSALRVISIQRGYDPKDFELCCFGGAGGLHVCALAEELGCGRIIVPASGGVLSAVGMLAAPRKRNFSHTVQQDLEQIDLAGLKKQFAALLERGRDELLSEGVTEDIVEACGVDMRYKGQSFTLNIAFSDDIVQLSEAFHFAHQQRYGHQLPLPIELVNIRVQLTAVSAFGGLPVSAGEDATGEPYGSDILPHHGRVALWERSDLPVEVAIPGPAIICEEVSTTFVGEKWQVTCDRFGHLRLEEDHNG